MAVIKKEMKTFNVPQKNGDTIQYAIVDAESTEHIEKILSTKEEDNKYHLGFYLDDDGDLCQEDE